MSNPLSRVIPDATIYLDHNALANKPEMAVLVTKVFAIWASIECELSFLLIRILKADSSTAAIAIYETLKAQHLKWAALLAAAKAELITTENYAVFLSVISIAQGAQTHRNHLAHWVWGGCHEKPDLLFDQADGRFYRDGCCNTGAEDIGSHTVCVVMTAKFLDFSKSRGNDLSTPVPEFGFPGLKPGDRWCLCAPFEADQAPRVVLRAAHEGALTFCSFADLKRLAMDLE